MKKYNKLIIILLGLIFTFHLLVYNDLESDTYEVNYQNESIEVEQDVNVMQDTEMINKQEQFKEEIAGLNIPGGISLAILDGSSRLMYSFEQNNGYNFYTASIDKILIAANVLENNDIDNHILDLITKSIRYSDNDATDDLYYKMHDIDNFVRMLNMNNTTFGFEESKWGYSKTTAGDQIRLLESLFNPHGLLSEQTRHIILANMSDVVSGQRWGVSAFGTGEIVYLKNGWGIPSIYYDENAYLITNSIGIVNINHNLYYIAILTNQAQSVAEGINNIEKIMKVAAQIILD